jgi:hypothetical protein
MLSKPENSGEHRNHGSHMPNVQTTWEHSNKSERYNQKTSFREQTRFNLDKLKNQDANEIKETAKKYPYLNQTQKNLIRHQAPGAFAAIVQINKDFVDAAKSSQETAFKAYGDSSKNASDANRDAFQSSSSREKRKDSFDSTDRIHERDAATTRQMNADNNTTYVQMAALTAISVVTVAAAYIFGKKE